MFNNEPNIDKFECGVCKKLCLQKCSRCYKICYCSVEHQKEDWENHKPNCRPWPVKLQTIDNAVGKTLAAAKRIRKGQMIFRERSMISGPSTLLSRDRDPNEEIKHVCLSCYKDIGTAPVYKCSRCHWPVCDQNCEKENIHSDFECKIFEARNILPKPLDQEITKEGDNIYEMICTLRTILLRKLNPKLWGQIMNIFSYSNVGVQAYAIHHNAKVKEFVQNTCGMADISDDVVKRIARILAFNARGNDAADHPHTVSSMCYSPRTASFLFHDLSFVGRSLNPNCVVTQQMINCYEVEVEVIAIKDIEVGDQIEQELVLSRGFVERAEASQEMLRTLRQNPQLGARLHYESLIQDGRMSPEEADEIVRQVRGISGRQQSEQAAARRNETN